MEKSFLEKIGHEITVTNQSKGWDTVTLADWPNKGTEPTPQQRYKIPGFLALLTSEVSEMLEAFRKGDLHNFEEEAADVFIRLLDITHGMGIPLEQRVCEKIMKNRARPHRHGGKVV